VAALVKTQDIEKSIIQGPKTIIYPINSHIAIALYRERNVFSCLANTINQNQLSMSDDQTIIRSWDWRLNPLMVLFLRIDYQTVSN